MRKLMRSWSRRKFFKPKYYIIVSISKQGNLRIQTAERDSLDRELRTATAEREESIKVAVAKQQLENDNLRLREDTHESHRKLKGSENRYLNTLSVKFKFENPIRMLFKYVVKETLSN